MDIRAVWLTPRVAAFKSQILLFGFALCAALSSCASQTVTVVCFRHYESNAILWAGEDAFTSLQLERRGIWMYSYVLGVSGYLGGIDIDVADNDSWRGLVDRLGQVPIDNMPYVDWDGDFTNRDIPYFPSGHVFTDSSGSPVGVVKNEGGALATVPVTSVGEDGWISDPVVYNGVTGRWLITRSTNPEFPGFVTDFSPSFNGGIANPSTPPTTISPFNPTQYNLPSTDSSSGETVNINNYTFNSVETTTTTSESGETLHVVNTPTTVVNIPTGGGSSGGGGNISFPVYDYSPILNAIGGVLQSHAMQNAEGLNAINENMGNYLTIDDGGVLQVAPTDDTERSIDYSQNNEILNTVSGWGFDFGMGSNPLGSVFTALLGNPPTSFGSVDRAWDVEFSITPDVKVRSTFSLSDWFPRAFRSAILMVLTILFAIASAHAVSNAFS